MSELQLGLAAIGVLVVVAVLAFNKWQESRLRRRTESAFAPVRGDALLRGAEDPPPAAPAWQEDQAAHVEHVLGDLDDASAAFEASEASEGFEGFEGFEASAASGAEPTGELSGAPEAFGAIESDPPGAGAAPAAGESTALPHALLDARLDCIATLERSTPMTGADVAARAARIFDAEVARRLHWEIRDADSGNWIAVRPGSAGTEVRVGLQLATRMGIVAQYVLESFVASTVELALALEADVNVIDTAAALQQAERLDRFVADFDMQIGFSVLRHDAARTIAGTRIRALAESAGFALGRDGRYRRHDETGGELYQLVNMEAMPFHAETMRTLNTAGVTLLLNVPCASGGAGTFAGYVAFARQFAKALDGALVDDNRHPLSDRAIEAIGAQLVAIHEAMNAGGIVPGSATARRLFA